MPNDTRAYLLRQFDLGYVRFQYDVAR